MLLLLLAWTEPAASGCDDYPTDPTPPPGVLGSADTCGYWSLAVGEHLYTSVGVTEAQSPCSAALGDGIVLNADPIYSAMSDDVPKWTFDVVGESSTGTGYAGVEIACDDGTEWSARIQVVAP